MNLSLAVDNREGNGPGVISHGKSATDPTGIDQLPVARLVFQRHPPGT